MRAGPHSHGLARAWGLFTAACAATMLGDLLRLVAEAGFVRRAGTAIASQRHIFGNASRIVRRLAAMRRSVSAGMRTMLGLDAHAEWRFRIAALRRTMRIGIRLKLRRKAIAVEKTFPSISW